MIKKTLLAILVILVILIIVNFELVTYGIGQGYGQAKILLNAKSVEKVLNDTTVDEVIKEKLRFVQEVREYSIEHLGLTNSKNYTTLFDQQGKPVLWVVRACHPYKLENFEWTFPFLGAVSYKGYFDLGKAINLRDQLKEEGYDTYIREVSAWSTLGWFKDPILSEMLKDTSGDLANTIIHELTHATIFVNDSITFNENLASFIGDKGAEGFLVFKYPGSHDVEEYRQLKEDRTAYASHFLNGAKFLDSLYNTFQEEEAIEEMESQKQKAIQEIIDELDTVNFNNPAYSKRFQEHLPNNAYFMSYLLYRSGQGSLDSIYTQKYNGNLQLFISEMKKLHPR